MDYVSDVLNKYATEILKSKIIINQKMMELMEESRLLLETNDKMLVCCKALEDAIKSKYPFCKAYPFGSRVTGLGTMVSTFLLYSIVYVTFYIYFIRLVIWTSS